MEKHEIAARRVHAIHVYRTGTQHTAAMDCVCEPIAKVQMEYGDRTIDIVVHGEGIEISLAVRGESPPNLGG